MDYRITEQIESLDPYSTGILDRLLLYNHAYGYIRLDPYSTGILDRLLLSLSLVLVKVS